MGLSKATKDLVKPKPEIHPLPCAVELTTPPLCRETLRPVETLLPTARATVPQLSGVATFQYPKASTWADVNEEANRTAQAEIIPNTLHPALKTGFIRLREPSSGRRDALSLSFQHRVEKLRTLALKPEHLG